MYGYSRKCGIGIYKKLEIVTAKVSYLDSENATLRKVFEISSKTNAETEADLAKNIGETHENLGNETRDCNVLKANVEKLEGELAALCDTPMANGEKIQGPELKVALNAMAIAHLTLVKDHCANDLHVTAENGKLRRRVNDVDEKNSRSTTVCITTSSEVQCYDWKTRCLDGEAHRTRSGGARASFVYSKKHKFCAHGCGFGGGV